MAGITNNGTLNEIGDNQLPAGYARPAVVTFADFEYLKTVQLSIPKATVENAAAATTLANILANGAVGINKQVTDLITADFDATKTVTIFSRLKSLQNNYQSMAGDSPAFTNAAAAYLATVEIYVKSV